MDDFERPEDNKVSGSANTTTNEFGETPRLVSEVVEDKYNEEKSSLYTVFGIFASVVAFLSIEAQILKSTCDFWKITGLSLIILSCLLLFVIALDYIGRLGRFDFSKQLKYFPWPLMGVIAILFAIGIGFSTVGNEQLCIENYIYLRYQRDFEKKQLMLEELIQSNISTLKADVDKSNQEIKTLKQAVMKIHSH